MAARAVLIVVVLLLGSATCATDEGAPASDVFLRTKGGGAGCGGDETVREYGTLVSNHPWSGRAWLVQKKTRRLPSPPSACIATLACLPSTRDWCVY